MTQLETLQDRWDNGRITLSMLKVYVKKGVITTSQFAEITGEEYTDGATQTEILNVLLGEDEA